MPIQLKTTVKYFDRKVFKTDWDKINRTPLQRAGVRVMQKARQSIRTARGKTQATHDRPSKPDKPPKSRDPRKPMKMIFSVPFGLAGTFAVGFTKFGSSNLVASTQEHGLSAPARVMLNFKEWQKARKEKLAGKRKRTGVKMQFARRVVRYPKRPTMQPALEKTKAQLPELWRDSIRG